MSEIKPIRLPVRYDPKRGVIRDEMGNIVAEIPVGFGDRVTIEKRNAEIGEQIAAALNENATEQLAEAKAKVARFEAMLGSVADMRGFSWHMTRRRENNEDEWLSTSAYSDGVYGPFPDALSAFEAIQEGRDG